MSDDIFDNMVNELNDARGFSQQEQMRKVVDDYRRKQQLKEQQAKEKRKKLLAEERGLDYFTEPVAPPPPPAPEPEPVYVVEEVKDTRSNVEMLSDYISSMKKEETKNDPQSIRETYSIEDRVKLLEQDLFSQMAKSTPNTLVAGIGASLDSGGGAVWLWDLEDVNIGTPINGRYPIIANGSTLVYNSTDNKWEVGFGGGSQDADSLLQGGIIDANGGESNTTGNLIIQQSGTGTSDGKLILQDGDGTPHTTFFPGGAATLTNAFTWKDGSTETCKVQKNGTIIAPTSIQTALADITSADSQDATINLQVKRADGTEVINSASEVTIFKQQVVVAPPDQILFSNENYNGFLVRGQGSTAIDKIFGVRDGNNDQIINTTGFEVRKNFRQYRNKDNNGTRNSFRLDGSTDADTNKTGLSELFGTNYSATINQDDSVRYYGVSTFGKDIANRDQIQEMINSGGGGLSFVFVGPIDVTSTNPPSGVSAGEYYSNTTAGNAGSGWTGIAGEPVAQNQLVIYTAAGEWATGAEVDTSLYVPLAGTASNAPITGDLTSTATITCDTITTPLTGTAEFNGDVQLGHDSTKFIGMYGYVHTNIVPALVSASGNSISCTLGTTNNQWTDVYTKEVQCSGTVRGQSIQATDAGYGSSFQGSVTIQKSTALVGGISRNLIPDDNGIGLVQLGTSSKNFGDIFTASGLFIDMNNHQMLTAAPTVSYIDGFGTTRSGKIQGLKIGDIGINIGVDPDGNGDNLFFGNGAGSGEGCQISRGVIGIGYLANLGSDEENYGNTYNLGIGYKANYNTHAGYNVAIGYQAIGSATCTGTGKQMNVAIGTYALKSATKAFKNIAIGVEELANATSLSGNVSIGYNDNTSALTTGGGNVCIGGYNSQGTLSPIRGLSAGTSNTICLGSSSITDAYIKVAWTVISDARDKVIIASETPGLDFINQLKPVTYQFKENREDEVGDGQDRYGFLAQDIKALEEKSIIIDDSDSDHLKMRSDQLVPILVEAVKELSARVKELESK